MVASVFSPPDAGPAIELELVAVPEAVRFTRRLVREWFRHWGLPEGTIEAGELVVSELVTNAVKAKGQRFRLRVRWCDEHSYIEVWDADPNPPTPVQAGIADTGGRGLFLVGQYATRWGYYPAGGGKVVWAELRCIP
jgi:anti-sigma regulatory factor (Ser/Thr protein kinase)